MNSGEVGFGMVRLWQGCPAGIPPYAHVADIGIWESLTKRSVELFSGFLRKPYRLEALRLRPLLYKQLAIAGASFGTTLGLASY